MAEDGPTVTGRWSRKSVRPGDVRGDLLADDATAPSDRIFNHCRLPSPGAFKGPEGVTHEGTPAGEDTTEPTS
jgi:hypothetical protein